MRVICIVAAGCVAAVSCAPSSWALDRLPASAAQSDASNSSSSFKFSIERLSPQARAVAAQMDLLSLIERIGTMQSHLASQKGQAPTVEYLSERLELADTKQELVGKILKATLEVDNARMSVDAQMALYTKLIDSLGASRDKQIMYSGVLAQLSNGFLWSIQGAYAIGGFKFPTLAYPDGIMSVVAGTTPSIFGLYQLYSTRGPTRKVAERPNMLAPVFDKEAVSAVSYPPEVFWYLNQVGTSEDLKSSRMQVLERIWTNDHYVSKPDSPKFSKKVTAIGGTASKTPLTVALLLQRQRMLADLRIEIGTMNRALRQMLEVLF